MCTGAGTCRVRGAHHRCRAAPGPAAPEVARHEGQQADKSDMCALHALEVQARCVAAAAGFKIGLPTGVAKETAPPLLG